LIHGTVRLYNFNDMRIATMREERAVMAEIQAYLNLHQEESNADLASMVPASL
jgi:hypothetical protein